MTCPSPDIIIARRHLVRSLLRGAIVALALLGLMPLAYRVLEMIPYGWGRFLERPFYTLSDQLYWAGTCAFAAGALLVLQSRLARWIVSWPQQRCPECGYRLLQLREPRCPECGCDLPRSMVSAEPGPKP